MGGSASRKVCGVTTSCKWTCREYDVAIALKTMRNEVSIVSRSRFKLRAEIERLRPYCVCWS